MTIKKLKELIKDYPDDMRIYADDASEGTFTNNSEFLIIYSIVGNDKMCVLQTRNDFETDIELDAWCEAAFKNNVDEQDFWTEFYEMGYVPADFYNAEKEVWAYKNLRHYGII